MPKRNIKLFMVLVLYYIRYTKIHIQSYPSIVAKPGNGITMVFVDVLKCIDNDLMWLYLETGEFVYRVDSKADFMGPPLLSDCGRLQITCP